MESDLNKIKKLKRDALVRALETWGGNRSHAARDLGVCIRTVRLWIYEFGLTEQYPPQYGPISHLVTPKQRAENAQG